MLETIVNNTKTTSSEPRTGFYELIDSKPHQPNRYVLIEPFEGDPRAIEFSTEPPKPYLDAAVVNYVSPHENTQVNYVVAPSISDYKKLVNYKIPSHDIFYVHVPPWAKVRSATEHELGEHVLGTAHMVTGEIRLLESLNVAERTEVLLHETMHLLYPMHDEKQIRDLVRTIMGKQYCHFH